MMKKINDDNLTLLNNLTPLNPFIYNRTGIIKTDNLDLNLLKRLNECISWDELYTFFSDQSNTRIEIELSKSKNEQNWVMMLGQLVSYKDQEVILAYLYDISNMKKRNFELERSTRLRALMLEVTQSIFIANSIEDIFDLSLNNSIKALEKSNYGSIMIRQDNVFIPVSYIGFTEDIRGFRLPCDQSFLARNTDNMMDRFVRINQEQLGEQTDFNKSNEDSIMIRSTLTGPIYIEGNLYGIINIDSLENNAFDDFDVQTMEFIRNNVEIAITNHLLYQEKLILSRYDSLTGLHNRHYFEEQFEINRKRASRYNESFAIVLFDIDNFKSINDRFGHFVGDQVLKHIAKKLIKNQRESDIMARFGGDEFIGVLYSTNIQELNKKYIDINTELNRQELSVDNTAVPCTFSFGIAQYPKDGKSLDELVKVADFEMYKNKRSRKFD
jgi:diguanylate cyclase (GGDEF)-like protein